MAPDQDQPPMIILGIETATEVCSVGLVENGIARGEQFIRRQRAHAECLPGMVEQLMRDTAIAGSDIAAIGVSVGPGSFTGLRVGLSAAKGYAAAWGIPVWPVETTAALALNLLQRGGCVIAGIGTRNRLLYAAVYHWSRTGPKRDGEFFLGDPRHCALQAPPGTPCIGPAGDGVWQRIRRRTGGLFTEAPALLHRPSAVAVAQVATLMALNREPEPWDTLEPLYLQGYPVRHSRS